MNRIRTRSTYVPSLSLTTRACLPTSVYGNWGNLPCFPINLGSASTVIIPGYPSEGDSINDEQMPGYGIKNVSHSKYTPPKWSDITGNCYVASPGTGYAAYDPYGAAQKYYPNSEISLQYAAYSAAEEMRARWTYTKVSGPASVNVQNRQGELPSRIVKALDGYHSTTDIIESRDFPRLLELLARRRNLANYMREIAGSLRGRQWSATLKELREIGLAAKFGLDPTVQQIQELIKELKTPKKRRGSSFSVALKSEGKNTIQYSQGFTGQRYGRYLASEDVKVLRIEGARVSYVPYEYQTETFQSLDKALKRWSPINQLGAAWEVLPLSFMIDYFLSVDDALDNIFVKSSSSIKVSYWTSTKTQYARSIFGRAVKAVYGYYPNTKLIDYSIPYLWSESWESYQRSRCEGPSVLDSLRLRAGPEQVFWSFLIGSGLVRATR